MKKAKDKNREKTGALFFVLTGAAVSAAVAALFAFAGFFIFIPYLNLASAAILVPAVCVPVYKALLGKTNLTALPARALTGFVSLAGAYIHICVITGVLSGVFGSIPAEAEDMNYTGIMEYIRHAGVVFTNAAFYLANPKFLWQDLIAWGEGGWPMTAASALTAQAVLPQIFIERKGYYHGAKV